MIKNVFLAIFIFVITGTYVLADQLDDSKINVFKLKNDKEAVSRILTSRELSWYKQKDKFNTKLLKEIRNSLYDAVLEVKSDREDNIACDIGLMQHYKKKLRQNKISNSIESVDSSLKLLRSHDYIDDVFLRLLLELNQLESNLSNSNLNEISISWWDTRENSFIIRNNDVEKLYSEFKEWPDENSKCLLGTWAKFKSKIYSKVKDYPKSSEIRKLNAYAYSKNIISTEVFQKLEVLRESNILEQKIFLGGYLNKIFWAKNTMTPKSARRYDIPIQNERRFASLKAYRFQDFSKREAFYHKYNEDQIIVLAKILQRASIRLGVDPDVQSSVPVIFQELTYRNEDGEYVTVKDEYRMDNAKDQYEYALRRMRMELFETNYYKSLKHLEVAFEDVVMAALETGYITHEEVSIVLEYDDIWKKEESKLWKAIKLSMGIGGAAVFYLPPPYNVIGAIGVALVNANVINKAKGEDNDNPNSIFN